MLSSCGPPSRLAPAAYPLFLRRRGAVRMRSASEGFCHRPSLVNSITNFPAWQEGSGRCSEIFYLFAAGNLGKSPEVRPSRSGLSTNRLLPAQDGGIRQKGAAGGRQTYFCARLRRNNFPHETHGCCLSNGTVAALSREGMFCASRKTPEESTKCFLLRAAVPFGLSPKRHQKRFFPSVRRPRRMNYPLLTGCDRLRLRR